MRLVDHARSAWYWSGRAVADGAAVAWMRAAARLDALRGRPEAALLRYGRAIRHLHLARGSMTTYELIDRLTTHYPTLLATHGAVPVRPQRFLLFVGHSRSGHSLIASLLDAHPNTLVSHELDALRHLERGHSFGEIIDAIQHNSRFFERFGRGYSGYSYEVASQYQGRFSELRVIGDKNANGTTRILKRNPGILDVLDRAIPAPVAFVHVVRNPFDNIASRARRARMSLEQATRRYFANANVVARLKLRYADSVIDVYLDDLVANPKATLAALLRRLGTPNIDNRYLDDCARIVFTEARRTRDDTAWDPALKRFIADRLGQYDFLRRFVREARAYPR
jgi:hypothetical protein